MQYRTGTRSNRSGRLVSPSRAVGWGIPALVLVVASFGLTACGPNQKPCGGGCKHGVCDESQNECVNADQCDPIQAGGPDRSSSTADGGMSGDAGMAADAGTVEGAPPSDCLEGYSCVNGECTADESCTRESDSCSRGVCVDGRCVNKDQCLRQKDCRPEFRCRSAECVYDPCANKNCTRGVCDDWGGQCVNASTCRRERVDKPPRCLTGYTCHDGNCHEKQGFCEDVGCDRGICKSDQAACVNAESCEDDSECIEGMYCADNGECEENKCYDVKRICDRGVCDPADRSCGNPESCSKKKDCAPMNWCIDGECVARSDACGDDGCPGNQVCRYDADNLAANCKENPNEACRSAVDCRQNRVCTNGSCSSPGPCSNDGHEPNDGTSEATDFHDARTGDTVGGHVCSGDVDFIGFDTSNDEDFRGQFTVSLEVDPIDVGISDLKLRVLRPDGSKWFEKTVPASEGEVFVQRRFGAGAPRGTYHVIVEDPGSLRKPGVGYRVLVDIVSRKTVRACEQAESLSTPTQSGNTLKGDSVGIDASCVRNGDEAAEDLYTFEIDEKSYVEVEVRPDGASDMTASIRRNCQLPTSEEACVNRSGVGGTEQLSATLEPGTYYLAIQGAGNDSGGEYTAVFSRSDANCTDADNRCVDSTTVEICDDTGSGLSQVQCATSCNEALARCKRGEGDICSRAIDASGGLSGHTVNWGSTYDDFETAGAACLPQTTDIGGPDKVYSVEVPANHVLLADLTPQGAQNGSLYVLDTCQDASTYCTKGSDRSTGTESLRFPNRTAQTKNVFLVADSPVGTGGTSTLNVRVEKLVCQPGERICDGKDVKKCNSDGTGRTTVKSCSFGCRKGGCEAEVCGRAFDVSSEGSWTFDPGNYVDDYDISGFSTSCFSSGVDLPGPDTVFEATVPAGEILSATLKEPSGSTYDGSIYLVEDCSSTSTHESTCRSGATLGASGSSTVRTANRTSSQKTFYIVVDAQNASGTTPGDWTIDVNIKTPACTPNTILSCKNSTTLQYCTDLGTKADYTCQGSTSPKCQNGQCTDPVGDTCVDPFRAPTGGTFTPDMSQYTDDWDMDNKSCVPNTSSGNDIVYEVSANAGQTITVTANPRDFSDDPALYVGSSCFDIIANSSSVCVAGSDSQFDGDKETLTYTVPSGAGGTYYVFIDGDLYNETDGIYDVDITIN